ncbi:MAG: hypothetical protein NVSMB66_2330 [Candidatus Doudnabacteria bacterium]
MPTTHLSVTIMNKELQKSLEECIGGHAELHDPTNRVVWHGQISSVTFEDGDPVLGFEWLGERQGSVGHWDESDNVPTRLYKAHLAATKSDQLVVDYHSAPGSSQLRYALLFQPGVITFDIRKNIKRNQKVKA